jgi:hypothetical protein
MPNNVSFGVQAKGVQKASSDLDNLNAKFAKLQKEGAKGIGIGLAAGATSFALGAAQQAVAELGNVVADSVKAFNEEQVSIQQLGTSLKANIPGWNGNTDAIEKTVHAQEALGFTDDEQRQSLALLVAATHDVTKAQQIQSVAMDLARFKGISLADATDALTKVEAGSYRILKSLGIELPKGATQMQALAAVEGVAAGQAADFAQTNEGKLLVSQVKVNDAMEKFGSVIAPAQADAMTTVANATEGAANALDVLQHGFSKDTDTAREQTTSILDLVGAFGFLLPGMGSLADATKSAMKTVAATTDTALGKAKDDIDSVSTSLATADAAVVYNEALVSDWGDSVATSTKNAADAFDKMKGAIKSDLDSLINDAFDPAIEADKLMATNAEIAANKVILASKKSTDAQKRDARTALHQLDKDQAQYLEDLANAGATGSAAYKSGIANLKSEIKSATGPTKTYLQGVLDRLLAIQNLSNNITIPNWLQTRTQAQINKRRAAGGPIAPGEAYTVGENGPETFVSDKAGRILPNGSTIGAGSPVSGGGITVNVYPGIGTTFTAAEGRRLADAILPPLLAGMQRKGVLPRTGTGLTG